jgi:hypothetical protein
MPSYLADDCAAGMVFAVLNARVVNVQGLETREGWVQFIQVTDSLAGSLDTIRLPSCPASELPNFDHSENVAMELDSTLCTDKAASDLPTYAPLQGLRPARSTTTRFSTLVPQYSDDDESDLEDPREVVHGEAPDNAPSGPSNWHTLNAAPAIPERNKPKDSSDASHSGSDSKDDGDTENLDRSTREKRRRSREPPDMTEAVPDPYDEAGRPPVGEYQSQISSSRVIHVLRSSKLAQLGPGYPGDAHRPFAAAIRRSGNG